MSDFNARAELHRLETNDLHDFRKLTGPRMVHAATVTECVNKVMAEREPDRLIYSMTIPLEAGFGKTEFLYRDIEAIAERPDFPKSSG
jgi:hypothetical protein